MEEVIPRIRELIPPGTRWALFNRKGEKIHSELAPETEDLASKIVKAGSELWEVGDYQVKGLEGGRKIMAFKVSRSCILVLEGFEKEGVLLLAARQAQKICPEIPEVPAPAKVEEALPPPDILFEIGLQYRTPEEALKDAGSSPKARALVMSLTRAQNIMQITETLRKAWVDITVEEVAGLIKELETKGVIRRRTRRSLAPFEEI
ncbi:MAG: hypothetical protein RMK30_02615 [Anaerolineae bacterium]|nr:hypothetical protein [Anaerolineae bacterium]MDW8101752.1 hypothetical protein [Anaerolineae bacterium]